METDHRVLQDMEIEESEDIERATHGQGCTVFKSFGNKCDDTPASEYKFLKDLDVNQSQAIKSKLLFNIYSGSYFCQRHHDQLTHVSKKKFNSGSCSGFAGVNHKKAVKSSPLTVAAFYRHFSGNNEGIFPGTKICATCEQKAKDWMLEQTIQNYEDNDEDYDPAEDRFKVFNSILLAAGLEQFIYKKLSTESRCRAALKRIGELLSVCATSLAKDGLEIGMPQVSTDYKVVSDNDKSLDSVMNDLKRKYDSSDYRGKVQVLTLAPSNWSVNKTSEFFTSEFAKCPPCRVRLALELKKTSGPLALPPLKKGKCLPDATTKLVTDFYCEDSISRVFPGMNDTIGVKEDGEKIRKTKRLLLGNLRDMHTKYLEEHGEANPIGFSKFCAVKPPEVKLAHEKGVHNVCVCQYHGNVTLMLEAIRENKLFRSKLLDSLVCENIVDGTNHRKKRCMLGKCKTCERPNYDMKLKFVELVNESIKTKHKKDTVTYSQWTTAQGRGGLQTYNDSVDDFIEGLYDKFVTLLPHHLISATQAERFKKMRTLEFLGDNKVVIQADFGENYSFLVQDAPQSFHWETTQATIHPFAAWLKVGNEVKCISAAVISNERRHDTESFFAYLKTFLDWLLQKYNHLTHIEYWSDGCAAQYKNCKNFDNLLHHFKDFGITASWNFFATSHGKGAVDGISGRLKESARRHSMRETNETHILDPLDLFNHCKTALPNIELFYVSKEDIVQISLLYKLESRFASSITYPQTRMCHRLVVNGTSLDMFRTSLDSKPFNSGDDQTSRITISEQFVIGDWLAVCYLSFWYLACVLDANKEAGLTHVHFVSQSGRAKSFKFSGKIQHNSAWVDLEDIITKVTPSPGKTTRTESHFFLSEEDRSRVETVFSKTNQSSNRSTSKI